MTSRAAVFAERWRIWLSPVLFLLANCGVFSVYRLAYAGRIEALDQRVLATESDRAAAESRRTRLESALALATESQTDMARLYRQQFSTERQRLTRMIAEVKGLADKSGLLPDQISYPVEEIADYGLVKKSVVFGVQGSYPQLRQLINFLELSSSFLTLESVRLSGNGDRPGDLKIDLTIATLFADENAAVPSPKVSTAPAAAAIAAVPAPADADQGDF